MMDEQATFILSVVRWIATLFSIAGCRWVAGTQKYERRSGFCIWMIANVIWIITSAILWDWAQVVLWSVYLYYAYVGWKNNE